MRKVVYIKSNNIEGLQNKVNKYLFEKEKSGYTYDLIDVSNNIVVDNSPKLMRQTYIQKITYITKD